MGYLPSLGSKAAHLVADITTVILNPISDAESPRRRPHHLHHPSSPLDKEEEAASSEKDDTEMHSETQDGPDTTSFRAFLFSLLSPSSSSEHKEEHFYEGEEVEVPTLTPIGKGSKGRSGIIARGKQSIGKIIKGAAKLGHFRQTAAEHDSETSHAHDVTNVTEHNDPQALDPVLDLPTISESSMLMTDSVRSSLYASLPVLVKGLNWVLLYSTWRHGISLSTLYRRSAICPGYSLLIVGDRNGAVFGGLLESPLDPSNKKKYQGTNSCFVFSSLSDSPVIYRPTGANHYFTLCTPEFLAFGGGPHFALYLDDELSSGSSSTSDTFNNQCLAHSEEFEVKEVELWGFVYASKYDEVVSLCRTEKGGICRW